MSTMTGPEASPMTGLVPSLMKELRELSGGHEDVDSEKIASAITNVMVLDRGIRPEDFSPGIRAIIHDCRLHPGRIQELKYVERELYGACTRPVTP